LLEYATLGWNVVGAAIVLWAAFAAHSVALAGFGLDSVIEVGASLVVVFQLKGTHADRERTALSLIGRAFVLLALYICAQSVYVLVIGRHPSDSVAGIVWLTLTGVAMFVLACAKRATGLAHGNRVLQTEAHVTLIDGLLASAVLLGLVLNAVFALWWADPATAFVIVYYGITEGYGALREARA
jgi:divalent metal cation (Fe/Co/Zn/Cd) transporter